MALVHLFQATPKYTQYNFKKLLYKASFLKMCSYTQKPRRTRQQILFGFAKLPKQTNKTLLL